MRVRPKPASSCSRKALGFIILPAHEDVAQGVAQGVVLVPKDEGARVLVRVLELCAPH